MNRSDLRRLERELDDFVGEMFCGMGRSERRAAMGSYVLGLLLDGERKSIEPMAGRLVDDAREIEAMRQRLQQCVSVSPWPDEEVRRRLACKLDQELPGIEAFVFDDTGFPKKGRHSVGVARQYSGTLGRVDNCQVAVSLHLAGELGSGCIGMRLYLPEIWTDDRKRCADAGVPNNVEFEPKWRIAIEQIDRALSWGVRKHLALADAAYGDCADFRDALTSRGLKYVVGVKQATIVWAPGTGPKPPPQPKPGQKARDKTGYTDGKHKPVTIGELWNSIKRDAREVTWRQGARGKKSSRFVAVRIRTAQAHSKGAPPGDEQWLLAEWSKREKEPKYHLSTLPANTSLRTLVRFAKMRWRVERDYQEMKQEVGLDHFEGRTWRGFHHHATLCAVAHGFLALQRALFSPDDEEEINCELDATDSSTRSSTGAAA
jgi:SRSO17 transposase